MTTRKQFVVWLLEILLADAVAYRLRDFFFSHFSKLSFQLLLLFAVFMLLFGRLCRRFWERRIFCIQQRSRSRRICRGLCYVGCLLGFCVLSAFAFLFADCILEIHLSLQHILLIGVAGGFVLDAFDRMTEFMICDFLGYDSTNRTVFSSVDMKVLWVAVQRLIGEKHPPYFVLEHTSKLLNIPYDCRGRNLGLVLSVLYHAGYNVEWRLIDPKLYGVNERHEMLILMAYKNNSEYARCSASISQKKFLSKECILSKTYPVDSMPLDGGIYAHLGASFAEDLRTFTFEFGDAGVMREGSIYTADVESKPQKLMPMISTDYDADYTPTTDDIRELLMREIRKNDTLLRAGVEVFESEDDSEEERTFWYI